MAYTFLPTNHNDPITPNVWSGGENYLGLTKREYFAALNMAAMLGSQSTSPYDVAYLAKKAVLAANATIEALNDY